MTNKKVDWTEFKSQAATFNLNIKYVEKENHYALYFSDQNLPFICKVKKTEPANDDQLDFQTNFKSASNSPLYHLKQIDTFTESGQLGTIVSLNGKPKKFFSINVKSNGGLAKMWSVSLETSSDGIVFSKIAVHTNTTGDGIELSVPAPTSALFFRANCVQFDLGGATDIVSTILGME